MQTHLPVSALRGDVSVILKSQALKDTGHLRSSKGVSLTRSTRLNGPGALAYRCFRIPVTMTATDILGPIRHSATCLPHLILTMALLGEASPVLASQRREPARGRVSGHMGRGCVWSEPGQHPCTQSHTWRTEGGRRGPQGARLQAVRGGRAKPRSPAPRLPTLHPTVPSVPATSLPGPPAVRAPGRGNGGYARPAGLSPSDPEGWRLQRAVLSARGRGLPRS